MRTKSVVKWGAVAIMVLGGLIAVMAYQADRISKHEYQWQRNTTGRRFSQEVPFKEAR